MAQYADNQQRFYEKAKVRQNILEGIETDIPELSYFLPETYNIVSSFPESSTHVPKYNFEVQDFLSTDASER